MKIHGCGFVKAAIFKISVFVSVPPSGVLRNDSLMAARW